jgi:spore cortex formation protein SpoVR/YcgB (stage V sporulation)
VDRCRAIIDYLVYAQLHRRVRGAHGFERVEELLDSCHALMNYGVDRYKRPQRLSLAQESAPARARGLHAVAGQRTVAHPAGQEGNGRCSRGGRFPSEPQENLLYFAEKNAPCWSPGSAR